MFANLLFFWHATGTPPPFTLTSGLSSVLLSPDDDPFAIDPARSFVLSTADPFGVAGAVLLSPDTDPFAIDPGRTTLIL